MYQFAAAQQTSTAKLRSFFQKFQTEERRLRFNKSKITGENSFNGDHFVTEGKYDLNNDERTLFWIFSQICGPRFNRQTAKYVYLRFSYIVWFLQFLHYFLLVLETSSKLNAFCTKLCVNHTFFFFCGLDVIVSCCAKSQFREINGISLEISNQLAYSKG